MQINVETIIFVYLFICVAMLIFNILFIVQTNGREHAQIRKSKRYESMIKKELMRQKRGKQDPIHAKLLEKKLKRLRNLTAYHEAIMQIKKERSEASVQTYLKSNNQSFQKLAVSYSKRNPMEKAYYAYLMSIYQVSDGSTYDMLMDILISYLLDSTVYCRENVLRALYALGNIQAIEKAFQIMNDQAYYHHPKLLSDGLYSFTGDRTQLAQALWNHHEEWNDTTVVAIINFIRMVSSQYVEAFFNILKNNETNIEIRLAILRYYRRYQYPEVQTLLQHFSVHSDIYGNDLAALSCSALDHYPHPDTILALKQAMHDRNWYVRRNAATSLIALHVSASDLADIIHGKDRYAKEMLEYSMRLAKIKE